MWDPGVGWLKKYVVLAVLMVAPVAIKGLVRGVGDVDGLVDAGGVDPFLVFDGDTLGFWAITLSVFGAGFVVWDLVRFVVRVVA